MTVLPARHGRLTDAGRSAERVRRRTNGAAPDAMELKVSGGSSGPAQTLTPKSCAMPRSPEAYPWPMARNFHSAPLR